MKTILLVPLISLFCSPLFCLASPTAGIPIDAVIATVDEHPITLSDLGKRLSPPRKMSLSQVGSDEEARLALDRLIFEKLIHLESEKRNVHVSDDEINSYVEEVAKRNGLEISDFEAALKKEGRNLADYKEEIKLQILRSKIASNYVRATSAVTDEEVDAYIKEHNITANSQPSDVTQVRLSQILISKEKHSPEEAKKILGQISDALSEGRSFEELARKYSDSPEGAEGGSLGLIAEKDLSPEIFDATVGIVPGNVSGVITTDNGYRLVRLDERINPRGEENKKESKEEVAQSVRAQVRKQLEQERLTSKMASFFESEISKLHTVEKKF